MDSDFHKNLVGSDTDNDGSNAKVNASQNTSTTTNSITCKGNKKQSVQNDPHERKNWHMM